MAVLALLWLACLVLGVGGPQITQAISNFGLIAAAASAGIACLVTARRSTPQHQAISNFGLIAAAGRPGSPAW